MLWPSFAQFSCALAIASLPYSGAVAWPPTRAPPPPRPPARCRTRAQAKMETPAGNTVHNLLVAVVLFGVTAMTLGIAGSFTNLGTSA